MLGSTDRVRGLIAERDELVVGLSEYEVFKKNLERKVSEKYVIIKAMAESVKQLKEKKSLLQDEINLLQQTNEEVRDIYDENKTPLVSLEW